MCRHTVRIWRFPKMVVPQSIALPVDKNTHKQKCWILGELQPLVKPFGAPHWDPEVHVAPKRRNLQQTGGGFQKWDPNNWMVDKGKAYNSGWFRGNPIYGHLNICLYNSDQRISWISLWQSDMAMNTPAIVDVTSYEAPFVGHVPATFDYQKWFFWNFAPWSWVNSS